MFVSDPNSFPLVGIKPVLNAQNHWAGLAFQMPGAVSLPALQALLCCPEAEELGALDFYIPLADPLQLEPAQLDALPLSRIAFTVPAASLADGAVQQRCKELSERGLRLMADGEVGISAAQAGIRGLDFDCAEALPGALAMMTLPGPHLARNVSDARAEQCRKAGFALVRGELPRAAEHDPAQGDGTSRKRLLALLGLLAQDADSRELEALLKQDPALSYQLLKLVNSAAFAPNSNPIHNFGQAINLLGRRQLQRWLQLLLYARQQVDGPANALLPLAALRAAQMEALCKLRDGDRDEQDLAFLVGVFSLLDVLLAMPMTEIVSALNLDLDVVAALLDRTGELGEMLALVEMHEPQASALRDVGIDNETYWRSLLQAYHWALQVSRNV
ncbi:MAG: signal transduction protein [Pseudoduganella sp.]|jgi:EAL and modified HD-GYP domain-containing signal transduction protein|nr:signal transduction protein [Pseudoduganella sp.]